MAIKPAQVDRLSAATARTPDPKIPMLRGNGGTDRRREQERRPLRLALVPFGHEAQGISPDLRIERALRRGLPLGLAAALVVHFAAVEAHERKAQPRLMAGLPFLLRFPG